MVTRITMTTIETRTRIKAYSTIPWPFWPLSDWRVIEITSFSPLGYSIIPRPVLKKRRCGDPLDRAARRNDGEQSCAVRHDDRQHLAPSSRVYRPELFVP